MLRDEICAGDADHIVSMLAFGWHNLLSIATLHRLHYCLKFLLVAAFELCFQGSQDLAQLLFAHIKA